MRDFRDLNMRNYKKDFDIIRTAYAELRVTDLARSRAWYVDLLGFVETARDDEAIYLRCLEEALHHSLVLRRAATPAVSHLGFKVSCDADLERLRRTFQDAGLAVRDVLAGTTRGVGRAVRASDPNGLTLEFFYEMEKTPRLHQQFQSYRGAHVMRIDHFNCAVPDIAASFAFWTETLGFRVSEYTHTDAPDYDVYAAWLHRKPNVHDIALTSMRGPRLHHIGFWTADTASVLRACDILAASGHAASIERGPGRHGISNAFFLYLRDPDGHRIELYTGDYLTADPDGEPLPWSINDPRRQTFWGQPAPASWFEEASLLLNLAGDEVLAPQEPQLAARVPFVQS